MFKEGSNGLHYMQMAVRAKEFAFYNRQGLRILNSRLQSYIWNLNPYDYMKWLSILKEYEEKYDAPI